ESRPNSAKWCIPCKIWNSIISISDNHLRKTRRPCTVHQRKALMADLADGFAALAGGYGTADELFEILTWAQLGLHAKPIGLLNTAGFFDPLLTWLDRCVDEGFMRPEHRALLQIASHPDELLDLLKGAQARPEIPKWINDADR